MNRLIWALIALVLLLGGVYVRLHRPDDWVAFLMLGVGVGIVSAVAGSFVHDVLADRPPQL